MNIATASFHEVNAHLHGLKSAYGLKVIRPVKDPPRLPAWVDLSLDAQLVMEAITEDFERQEEQILQQMLPCPKGPENYYNSVYRGSFNADIPSKSNEPLQGMDDQTLLCDSRKSTCLFCKSTTQNNQVYCGPSTYRKLHQVFNESKTNPVDPTVTEYGACSTPRSEDYSSSSQNTLVAMTENTSRTNTELELHGISSIYCDVLSPGSGVLCEDNNSDIYVEEHCAENEVQSLSDHSLDLSVNVSFESDSEGQEERKVSKKMKANQETVQTDDKGDPSVTSVLYDKCPYTEKEEIPSRRQKLFRCASVEDTELDEIEKILSVSRQGKGKAGKKFKAPFKPSSDKTSHIGGEKGLNKRKFLFNDQDVMKDLNIFNIKYLSSDDRIELSNNILSCEEAVLTVVFNNGTTLLSAQSYGDNKRKQYQNGRKMVAGLAIGYHKPVQNLVPQISPDTDIKLVPDSRLTCIYIPADKTEKDRETCGWTHNFLTNLMKSSVRKVSFSATEVFLLLLDAFKFDSTEILSWTILDCKVAAWLLDPDNPIQSFENVIQKSNTHYKHFDVEDCGWKKMVPDLELLATTMLQLYHKMKSRDLWPLFTNLETRIVPVLAKLERTRIKVDADLFLKFSDILKAQLTKLEKKAHQLAGHSFSINSHLQLRQVIFEELRLDQLSTTKLKVTTTSVNHLKSTSEAVLTQLSDCHELPGIILEYRQMQKLKSTYVDGLLGCVKENYIQTHWDQTAAATGRLTSYQPNLQSVPKQPVTITDYKTSYIPGNERVSKSFELFARDPIVSENGKSLISADFQQIELRLLAHLADDPKLISIFTGPQNEDIFVQLTAQWLGKSASVVSHQERERTKRVVYSVMYGAGKEKLSEYLKIDPQHAKAIIMSFLETFPAINSFTKKCRDFCRSHGYTCTIFNRRRLIPNIKSKSLKLRAQAERQAVNFCVQGSAADICKAAMIQVEHALVTSSHINARLLLQIHDELLYEVSDEHLEDFSVLVKTTMESAEQLCGDQVHLKIPLVVSVSAGKTWGHMQDIKA